MEPINANTRISTLLKQHPDALEAIVSISPKFTKLRNPLLRKLMASRTTISMASKIGGCKVEDFFEKLKPLGFEIDTSKGKAQEAEVAPVPDFVLNRTAANTKDLDVRPVLEAGNDPLTMIMDMLKPMKAGEILRIINTFDPIPLILLLEKQGYKAYSEIAGEDLVYTYFYNPGKLDQIAPELKLEDAHWDELVAGFGDRLDTIDVRMLEMPLPMLTILEHLEHIEADHGLYVYHKRIPVFLLPELQDRKFDYRIKEISDGEVHLLIFKA
ncbi:MAG: DUF2249 domain-containing protein [Chitinophagales bacterium]|nr:DUF2249 domain-containing protein [Chitinophagales bacterium]